MKRILITGEDTFFITLLATWLSVRINEWGSERFMELFVLIVGLLTFSLLLAEIRHSFLVNGNPALFDEKSRNFSLKLRFSLFVLLIIIVLYFSWNNDTYLQLVDKYVFGGVGLLWSVFLFYEKLSSYKFQKENIPLSQDISQGG